MKFLEHLRRRGPKTATTPFPPPTPDLPVWIIGDVHGCAPLLDQLIDRISETTPLPPEAHVVMVGDYVDRGEDSAGVLARVHAWELESPHLTALRGNHEHMMLSFLDRPAERGQRWLHHGGLQTLASFGIGGVVETSPPQDMARAAQDLREALPAGLEDWLRARPILWSSGNLHVVHAGADPRRAIDDQEDMTLIWGHRHFASQPRADGQWIAHGHTITDHPGSDGNGRIATDTGAYFSGALTAVRVLPSGEITVLST